MFSNLSHKNLEAISCQSMEYHVAKNKRLFTKGKGKCSGLFLIVAGSCELHDENDKDMTAKERLIASSQRTMGGTRAVHMSMGTEDLFDEPIEKVSTNAILGLDALLANGVPQSTCIATSMVVYIFIPVKVVERAKLTCGDVNVNLDEMMGKKRQHLKRTARKVRNSIANVIRGSRRRFSTSSGSTVVPVENDVPGGTKLRKKMRNSITGMRMSLANMLESKPTVSFGVGGVNQTISLETRDQMLQKREEEKASMNSVERPTTIRRTQSQQSRLSALFRTNLTLLKRAASVSGISEAPVLRLSMSEALFLDQAICRETAMHLCLTALQKDTRTFISIPTCS
jgi:hypothetical protein